MNGHATIKKIDSYIVYTEENIFENQDPAIVSFKRVGHIPHKKYLCREIKIICEFGDSAFPRTLQDIANPKRRMSIYAFRTHAYWVAHRTGCRKFLSHAEAEAYAEDIDTGGGILDMSGGE